MTHKEQLEYAKNKIIADCDEKLKEATDNDKIVVLLDLKERVIAGDFDESIMKNITPSSPH